MAEEASPYAGFWKRFVAAIIDGVLLVIVNYVLNFFVIFPFLASRDEDMAAGGVFVIKDIVPSLVYWIYFAVLESSPKQATLGKMALSIKVTDLAGERLSFGRATGRNFGKIISFLVLLIGYIMVAFTEKKQGLHDMMASQGELNGGRFGGMGSMHGSGMMGSGPGSRGPGMMGSGMGRGPGMMGGGYSR